METIYLPPRIRVELSLEGESTVTIIHDTPEDREKCLRMLDALTSQIELLESQAKEYAALPESAAPPSLLVTV
jgi:hypothetical protein